VPGVKLCSVADSQLVCAFAAHSYLQHADQWGAGVPSDQGTAVVFVASDAVPAADWHERPAAADTDRCSCWPIDWRLTLLRQSGLRLALHVVLL